VIEPLQPDVKQLMDKDPSARVPVILTVYDDAGETAVDLRALFGPEAEVRYLSGYVFASLNQNEVSTILENFPGVKFISLNRKVTHA
jgi:hypothetical protein